MKRKGPPNADWVLRQSDWGSPILSYDQVASAVEKLDQAATLKHVVLLLSATSKTCSPLVVVPGAYNDAVRTPGEVNGKLSLRLGRCIQVTSAGALAPQPKDMKQISATVKLKETVVVNVKIFKRSLDDSEWRSVQSSPMRFFHTWLAKRRFKTHDSFNWAKEKLPGEGETKFMA